MSYHHIAALMQSRYSNLTNMRFPTQVDLAVEHYLKSASARSSRSSRSSSSSGSSRSSSGSSRSGRRRGRGTRGRGRRTRSRSASASASPKHTMSSADDLYKALLAASKTQSSGFLGEHEAALGVEQELREGNGPGPHTKRLYSVIHEALDKN